MRKLRYISKYTLAIAAMLAVLAWVWSCAEKEGVASFEDKIPKGYAILQDGNIPNELLDEVFAKGNMPPQEVLDNAGFAGDASEYQWIVHMKQFVVDTNQSGHYDLGDYYTYMRILKPNEELQAYIGIKGGSLGNGAKLAIVANDASVVIENWMGSDDWKNETTKESAFDIDYSENEDSLATDVDFTDGYIDATFDFYLDEENDQKLNEVIKLLGHPDTDQGINAYRVEFNFDYIYNYLDYQHEDAEDLVYYDWKVKLLVEPLTLADKAKQEKITVDGMVFVYPDSIKYPNEDYTPNYFELGFFSANYEAFLEEIKKFTDPSTP